ncbi:outer membrane beta-barrel protein [Lutibacter aestuarii]|uniref:Outer membrane beta-barrel protein n=1 Tax=Lutibacter aestuarii TaxID=861111 RepID=A0ABW2Z971_9FLAO
MKKRILVCSLAFIATVFTINAQSSFGIKGGLSYNSNGELKEYFNNIETVIDNKGKGKSGYNLGFYGKLDLGPIYLRPELVYTKTTSEYELNSGATEDYKISKLDMPVLVGFKLIGPLNVFAGPAFQYYLDNDLHGLNFKDIENEFSVGLNIGASIELGRIGLDVRYERGLSENEANFVNDNIVDTSYRLDSRPEQIIFSLSYRLSNSNKH